MNVDDIAAVVGVLLIVGAGPPVAYALDGDDPSGLKVIDFRDGTSSPDASTDRPETAHLDRTADAPSADTDDGPDGEESPFVIVERHGRSGRPIERDASSPSADAAGSKVDDARKASVRARERLEQRLAEQPERTDRETLLLAALDGPSDIVCSEAVECCYRIDRSPDGIVVGPIDPARQRALVSERRRREALQMRLLGRPGTATPDRRGGNDRTDDGDDDLRPDEAIRQNQREARLEHDRALRRHGSPGRREPSLDDFDPVDSPSDGALRSLRSSIAARTRRLQREISGNRTPEASHQPMHILGSDDVEIHTAGSACGELLERLRRSPDD
ncbi:MAG: hypothetical protein ABEL76_01030 [Bradymonadaceae bacterium]